MWPWSQEEAAIMEKHKRTNKQTKNTGLQHLTAPSGFYDLIKLFMILYDIGGYFTSLSADPWHGGQAALQG